MAETKKLNKSQKDAAEHKDGPLLIVAGAGTGKTTVLIERLNFLITKKLAHPEEILLITFTEKAAGELEERADKILPYGYVDLWINTFHGFCKRILDDYALDIGLPGSFKVLTQTEQWMFIRKHLDEFELDYYKPLGNPTKFIHEIIKHFSKLKDENISSKEYLNHALELKQDLDKMMDKEKIREDGETDEIEAARINELANAYFAYNKLLLKNNFLDFGDLIVYVLKLFKERPNILKHYQKKFKFVMVDEFQDTNLAQYELLKIISGKKKNLMVVGDDSQSVYKFRGASMSNIMQFKDDFPRAKMVVLNDNYRSGQKILDTAYEFIKYNDPNTLESKLGISKELKSYKKGEGSVEVLSFDTETDEASGVAEKIIELRKKQNEQSGEAWSDFAVLIRANSTANVFINELTKKGIPNVFVSMKGLYYKPIILDILAYFKLLDNYHESAPVFRVLNMAVFRVGYKEIIEINKFAKKKVWSTFEALKNINAIPQINPESIKNINRLVAFIEKHSELARTWKASSLLIRVIKEIGIVSHLDHDKDFEVFEFLNQFYNHIKSYEQSDQKFSVKDLLTAIDFEMEAGEAGSLKKADDDEDKVKVMTIHSAKGLEFKYVFVVSMVDKRFPTIAKKDKIPIPEQIVKEKLPDSDTHIEEERRLFYVAMTRAKDKLFFTHAFDYGGATAKKPSKFLSEAGFLQGKTDIKLLKKKNKRNEFIELILRDEKELQSVGKKIFIPSRFSFSQIEGYTKCPLQYKFAFILKIPAGEKPSLNFGRVMHSTLRQFFSKILNPDFFQDNLFGIDGSKKQEKPKKKDLLDIYGEYWNPDGYRNKKEREKYYKKGKKILEEFYDKIDQKNWPEVVMLEKGFNIKMNGNLVKGSVDRVDRLADDTYEIIDYKTGNPKEKIDFSQKRQLILYKLAIEELFGKKVSKLTFYYLENNTPLSFSASDKQIEKLQEQITETISKIKSCNFAPTPGIICSWCDFNGICEFRAK